MSKTVIKYFKVAIVLSITAHIINLMEFNNDTFNIITIFVIVLSLFGLVFYVIIQSFEDYYQNQLKEDEQRRKAIREFMDKKEWRDED